jgi:short-subunit dehydrogenase
VVTPDSNLVVVIGGSGDIGSTIVSHLLEEGFRVVNVDKDSLSLPSPNKNYQFVACDLKRTTEIEAAVSLLKSERTPIMGFVYCAGLFFLGDLEKITDKQFEDTMEVNLVAAYRVMRRIKPQLATGSRLIWLGSIAAEEPLRGNIAYGTSKAALKYLSCQLGESLIHEQIYSTYLTIGAVRSRMIESNFPGVHSHDLLEPREISQTILNLFTRHRNERIDEIKLLPKLGRLK